MAKSKLKLGTDLADRARERAKAIYEQAGAFLMRTVCDELSDLLRELAKQVDGLDGEVRQLRWECEQAQDIITQQALEISALNRALNPNLFDESSNSMTGGQGFTE